ncbi:MAG: MBL fold metallo-hydrolase [Ruminococcus sp.]|nr:MBL fold metallo-hydrolase [Ruminococcus sp.]
MPFHSSIRINSDKVIYIDPFRIDDERHDADIILLIHDHFDHFSKEDIAKVMNGDTAVFRKARGRRCFQKCSRQ